MFAWIFSPCMWVKSMQSRFQQWKAKKLINSNWGGCSFKQASYEMKTSWKCWRGRGESFLQLGRVSQLSLHGKWGKITGSVRSLKLKHMSHLGCEQQPHSFHFAKSLPIFPSHQWTVYQLVHPSNVWLGSRPLIIGLLVLACVVALLLYRCCVPLFCFLIVIIVNAAIHFKGKKMYNL